MIKDSMKKHKGSCQALTGKIRTILAIMIAFCCMIGLSNVSPAEATINMYNVDTGVQGIIGTWLEDGSPNSRTLKINPGYTYELIEPNGATTHGTIKVWVEEYIDGSYVPWFNFTDNDGHRWADFAKNDLDGSLQTDLWSGQDGAMHFARCNNNDYAATSEGVAPKDYLGVWGCGRCTIAIEKKANAYIATITWANSAAEQREWVYNCRYDKQNAILVSPGNGICTDSIVYDNGKEADINVYDDGSCEFIMREGVLKWKDKKENAAQDMDFIR
ncbi:MAG: hypothetical protein K6C05_07595 [Anaerovibrio sp.]|uniref:hypothetical protein n=1 Tax=Anaerovibrio sp. TaxID=1872532 RepID=UPI0025D76168|nr:hypothetical protein [Anaerovibrio sp.]MCR5176703.1 hypothetical protein [Anaerovibrio sp.]